MLFPAWVARSSHKPEPVSETKPRFDTEQATLLLVVAIATSRPEFEAAAIWNDGVPKLRSPRVSKRMVWFRTPTTMRWLAVAAAYLAEPTWLATISQSPAAKKLILVGVVASNSQAGVVLLVTSENVTGRALVATAVGT